eukprot:8718570-Karenia_brevis.AAC.1
MKVEGIEEIKAIPAANVSNDASGVAFLTRDTFKTRAAVRSQSYLACILPGHINKDFPSLGLTSSSFFVSTIFVTDPIRNTKERKQVTIVNLGAKPVVMHRAPTTLKFDSVPQSQVGVRIWKSRVSETIWSNLLKSPKDNFTKQISLAL